MKGLYEQNHPTAEELALAARGDLPVLRGWRVSRHARHCPVCRCELELFTGVREAIRREELTWEGNASDWDRLEREMTGNIKVGIAAAQCIESSPARKLQRWKVPALVTGLSIIFVAGWLLNVPREDRDRVMAAFKMAARHTRPEAGAVLETNPLGVSIRVQGATLTLLHPASARATASFTGSSSVGVRYVDNETGQVTIANVYGE